MAGLALVATIVLAILKLVFGWNIDWLMVFSPILAPLIVYGVWVMVVGK